MRSPPKRPHKLRAGVVADPEIPADVARDHPHGILRNPRRSSDVVPLSDNATAGAGENRELRGRHGDALAMPAGRKAPVFDHHYLLRYIRVDWIMCDRVDARLQNDFTRPYCCAIPAP